MYLFSVKLQMLVRYVFMCTEVLEKLVFLLLIVNKRSFFPEANKID